MNIVFIGDNTFDLNFAPLIMQTKNPNSIKYSLLRKPKNSHHIDRLRNEIYVRVSVHTENIFNPNIGKVAGFFRYLREGYCGSAGFH